MEKQLRKQKTIGEKVIRIVKTIKRVWNFFRYDIHQGVRNLFYFFPVVWKYRVWDYEYILPFILYGLRDIRSSISTGLESESTRDPKIAAISRAIYILEHVIQDDWLELAEEKLGKTHLDKFWNFKRAGGNELNESGLTIWVQDDQRTPEEAAHDRVVMNLRNQMEDDSWDELFDILKGDENIPGSDMRGWWD